jgi:hypothetical protein
VRSRGDEEVSLDPTLLRTDLADVWTALRDGRPEDALARYGGELLPGLFPPDSDGFLRWLDGERTRLKVALSSAATTRVDELERNGDVARALAVARQIAAINPDDETVVRRVIALHEKNGDRAGALLAFENYRARLASEFDAEPAPETLALATRLRATTSVLTAKTSPPPAVVPGTSAVTSAPPKRSAAWVVAAVVVLAATTPVTWNALRPARPLAIGKSAPLTADEGLQVEAAISPNGRLVASRKEALAYCRSSCRRSAAAHRGA